MGNGFEFKINDWTIATGPDKKTAENGTEEYSFSISKTDGAITDTIKTPITSQGVFRLIKELKEHKILELDKDGILLANELEIYKHEILDKEKPLNTSPITPENIVDMLGQQGWRFTMHHKDLGGSVGHGKAHMGLTVEEVRNQKKTDPSLVVVGAKGGIQVRPDIYSLIIDFDAQDALEWFEKNYPEIFNETLATKGSKGGHRYFETDRQINKENILRKKGGLKEDQLIDLIGSGAMAIMPPSPHRRENLNYTITNDKPVLFVPWEQLHQIFTQFTKEKKFWWNAEEERLKEVTQNREETKKTIQKTDLTLEAVLGLHLGRMQKLGSQMLGEHPAHGSTTGKNFCVDLGKQTWYCFRCGKGGGPWHLFAVMENIISCDQSAKGGLTGDLFKKAVERAEEKGLIPRSNYKGVQKKPKEAKKEDEKIKFVCFKELNGILYQQVHKGFYTNTGELKGKFTDNEGFEVNPIQGEEIDKKVLILATKPEDYKNFKDLIDETKTFIKKYSDISEDFLQITALYIALTWVYDRFDTVPYWRVKGDYGTGKTRIWDVVRHLACNPLSVTGALTSAPVFRMLEKWQPLITLFVDETDMSGKDENTDIVKIINTGFQKSGIVMRCNQNDASKVEFFRTFGPKLFSMRYPFEDAATESRCLSYDMKRTKRQDIPPELPKKFYSEAETLRNKFFDYRLKNWAKVNPAEDVKFPENMEGRLKQIAISFYPLFNSDEEKDWFNDWLVNYQKRLRAERAASWQGAVLQAIIDKATSKNDDEDDGAEQIYPTVMVIAKQLGVQYKQISKEARALGFDTEMKHFVTNAGKRKTIRALVIGSEKWFETCDRYHAEGSGVPRPELLTPENESHNQSKISGY